MTSRDKTVSKAMMDIGKILQAFYEACMHDSEPTINKTRFIGVGNMDDIENADFGYLDEGHAHAGIRFRKPVLVNSVDYANKVVRFICKDGQILERQMDEFRKTWAFIKGRATE